MRILGFVIGILAALGVAGYVLIQQEVVVLEGEANRQESNRSGTAGAGRDEQPLPTGERGRSNTPADETASPQSEPASAEFQPRVRSDSEPPAVPSRDKAGMAAENRAARDSVASSAERLNLGELTRVEPAEQLAGPGAQNDPERPEVPATGGNTFAGSVSAGIGKGTQKWQPFWGPFNTHASAQGFADTVAEQTELEIRVVEEQPGRFRAAYSYASEDERLALKAYIENHTGLQIEFR